MENISDVCNMYLPMDRRISILEGKTLPEDDYGSVLFLDIAGFTKITEILVSNLGTRVASEEMFTLLNRIYDVLIECIHKYRGSVITISGDAITAWFSNDNGHIACTVAILMHEASLLFKNIRLKASYKLMPINIGLKISVATGFVKRFIVGCHDIQSLDVIMGSIIETVVEGERACNPYETLITPETYSNISTMINDGEWVETALGKKFWKLKSLALLAEPNQWELPNTEAISDEYIKQFILPPIYNRLLAGKNDFLSEFRPVTIMFLRFIGLDFKDKNSFIKIDSYISWVQTLLFTYEAYVLNLTLGDKGNYCMIAFGAPVTEEDDNTRALDVALKLISPPPLYDFLSHISIGISRGSVLAGSYGSKTHRGYTIIGEDVNISARLMELAKNLQILITSRTCYLSNDKFTFINKGVKPLKGKSLSIPVYELIAKKHPKFLPNNVYTQLIGRENVFEEIKALSRDAKNNIGQVIHIEGVTGIGKSLLVNYFANYLIQDSFEVFLGVCQQNTSSISYYPWRQILLSFLGIEEPLNSLNDYNKKNIYTRIEKWFEKFQPNLVQRIPILCDVLDIQIPDNEYTSNLSPKIRQDVLFSLVIDIIKYKLKRNPILIVFEDSHWIDSISIELLKSIFNVITTLNIIIIIVERKNDDNFHENFKFISGSKNYTKIELIETNFQETQSIANFYLKGATSKILSQIIYLYTQGNPFFIEEICNTLKHSSKIIYTANNLWDLNTFTLNELKKQDCIFIENGLWALKADIDIKKIPLDIPDSIYGVVLSRMDKLHESYKLSLKTASIIGKIFDTEALLAIHPQELSKSFLIQSLNNMVDYDFLRQELSSVALSYIFKHNITYEIAYSMLIKSQRKTLHEKLASYYENMSDCKIDSYLNPFNYKDDPRLVPYYPILVYHYKESENLYKERFYSIRYAIHVTYQYASDIAISFYTRALELCLAEELFLEYSILLKRVELYHLTARYDKEKEDLDRMLLLANNIGQYYIVNTLILFNKYYDKICNYDEMLKLADRSMLEFNKLTVMNSKLEMDIFHNKACALMYFERYQESLDFLNKALIIAENNDDISSQSLILKLFGNLFYYISDYDSAEIALEKSVAIRIKLKNQYLVANTRQNLIHIYIIKCKYSEAKNNALNILEFYKNIGYRKGMADSYNNLGNIYRELGYTDKIKECFTMASNLYSDIGDVYFQTIVFGNIGLFLVDLGEFHQAELILRKSIELLPNIHRKNAYSLTFLGFALSCQGLLKEALKHHMEAIKIREKSNSIPLSMDNYTACAEIQFLEGDYETSNKTFQVVSSFVDKEGSSGMDFALKTCILGIKLAVFNNNDTQLLLWSNRAKEHIIKRYNSITDKEDKSQYLQHGQYHKELKNIFELNNIEWLAV